ncbi:MAG: hypothetical protein WBB86_00430 [Candidatus Omnitrophota bacterium]
MKMLISLMITGSIIRMMVITPPSTLPQYPVMGTEKHTKVEQVSKPEELRYMSKKMYYLKTGRSIDTERSHKRQQNFWGKGVPSRVQFPSHLVMYEKHRKFGNGKKLSS